MYWFYFACVVDKLIRFRYYILFGAFALWMLFFDSNNLFYRMRISSDIKDLEKMKKLHVEALADLNRQKTELLGNTRNLEKFARERYLMKRDNEDLFVIIVDSTEKN
ncbi:MAG: septum formation initiator family protein [Bacteroidia bacterium]|nr:septum formation initiator family protein [Bacteroidia bacterium]